LTAVILSSIFIPMVTINHIGEVMDIMSYIRPVVEEGHTKASCLPSQFLYPAVACSLRLETVEDNPENILSNITSANNSQEILKHLVDYMTICEKPCTTQNEANKIIAAALQIAETLAKNSVAMYSVRVDEHMEILFEQIEQEKVFIKEFPKQAADCHASR